jgi:glycosyltransferase involved in cell wall biosynthesis
MISVVVPTYNEEKNIENCLKSLLNQSLPKKEYEIIVVDGQSKDKTVKIAKKYADKVVQQKSKGVGGARNDGVDVSKGEIIATTDADCIIPENWLEKIKRSFENKKVVLVTGNIKFIDPGLYYQLLTKMSAILWWTIYKLNLSICCSGVNISFRKNEFCKVGGFKNIPVLDDFELSTRLKRIGDLRYDSKLVVYTSMRRIKEQGISKVFFIWSINVLRILLGFEVEKMNYTKHDYNE